MNRWTSYNLLFFIKRKKLLKSGKASLYVKITVNKNHTEFVLNCSVNPDLWNGETGAAKGNSQEAKLVNEFLNSVKFKFQSIINKMITGGVEVTAENLKNKYLGIEPKIETILSIFLDHNKKTRALEGIDYAPETCLRYETCYRHLKRYIKSNYNKEDMELNKVNHKFISGLEFFIKSEIGCSHNTTMKYLKNFKKITRIALNNGLLKQDPFVNYKLPLKKVDRDFLSDEDLNLLINKKFTIDRLEIVKDCFLFACYTGLAHSDLKRLTKQNLIIGIDKKHWISIKRKKTNTQSNIPLLPVAEAIIEKYKEHPIVTEKNVLLPVASNQKMNAYLKEIADICGITKTLTSHVARHTFATTITLNNDVPIESVSKMLGHSSLEMTRIYARLLDKKVGRDMNHLAEKYSGRI
ncbi:MAG: site-specific integrase [Bacteroidetes bacterium]|nr:site-specific integrase [Bacteroidota bacterium]